MKILIVEDNTEFAALLSALLRRNSYTIDVTSSLAEAREAVLQFVYDLVLLDRTLGDGDGLDLVKFCITEHRPQRFVVLSALDETAQRVLGLDTGAIDYITKPFEPDELLARIRVALKFPQEPRSAEISIGDLTYCGNTRTFTVGSRLLDLRRSELIILECLVSRPDRVLTREAIEDALYGIDLPLSTKTIDPHISRLRKKIQSAGAKVKLTAHRGLGYSLSRAD